MMSMHIDEQPPLSAPSAGASVGGMDATAAQSGRTGGVVVAGNGGAGSAAAGSLAGAGAGSGAAGAAGAENVQRGWLKQLTLDGAQIGAELSDFPLLVRITDTELKVAARSDASDIAFFGQDGTTLLEYEIERYDSQGGSLVAWVRIPHLSAGEDAIVQLAYGEAQSARGDVARLWSGYHYVWHMAQDPGGAAPGSVTDSTERADGTPQGGMTAANRVDAVAGAGLSFDGVDDSVTFRNDYTGAGATTLGAWIRLEPGVGANGAMVVAFGSESVNRARFLLAQDTVMRAAGIGAGFYSNDISGPALAQQRWSYLVWTWDGSNSNLYVDGELAAGPVAHLGATTEGTLGTIGASIFSHPRYFKGQLDELRLAPGARPSAFIRTEYMNQRPGSTFIKAIGAQQPRR